MPEYLQLPFFDFPEVYRQPEKSAAQLARELRPQWRKYDGRHQPCGECVRELHAAGGRGDLPAVARNVRTVVATDDRRYLCDAHAEPLRDADGLKRPAKATRRRR